MQFRVFIVILIVGFFNLNFLYAQEAIPSIKAEMGVNEVGELTYNVPIDVLQGVNNFQPNLALGYNSRAGNGMAGWGWNILGLSMITQGGKSKEIDGITIGRQFNTTDPFYLDGQRLLMVSASDYVTEKYSKIKITRHTGQQYSFTIQYQDGKVAKYKELVTGQHYIAVLTDALDNSVYYSYTTANNVASITTISYGGSNSGNNSFNVQFVYTDRTTPVTLFRNGNQYKSTKVLSEIIVSSTYLTVNAGVYRKYKFSYDLIYENTTERLIKVEVKNGNGNSLKPLNFSYNSSTVLEIQSQGSENMNRVPVVEALGRAVLGDFLGTGEPYPIYENITDAATYKLYNPQVGIIRTYDKSRQLFPGKALFSNTIPLNDQAIDLNIAYFGDNYGEGNNDHFTFTFSDAITPSHTKQVIFDLPGVIVNDTIMGSGGNIQIVPVRDKEKRKVIPGDFNSDGLTDILILQPGGINIGNKYYLAEIGKPTYVLTELFCSSTDFNPDAEAHLLEFNGDGIPEIMTLNNETGKYVIAKINLETNFIQVLDSGAAPLNDFSEKTPLIFGDYNGDGLTDFMTPVTIFDIKNSTAAKELKKINTQQLLWWEYISTGTTFIRTQKNYTSQKLAYIAPSQRNIITNDSDGWSVEPDVYQFTEYGASKVLAIDVNSDGKSDLVTFRKFGKVKFGENLWASTVDNLNSFNIGNEIVDSSNANKIITHITVTQPDGSRTLVNSASVSIENFKISPFALVYGGNNTEYKNHDTYINKLIIHDPLAIKTTYFKFVDDNFKEGLLQNIDNGSSVIQRVEYSPMIEKTNSSDEKIYYTSDLYLQYPYYSFRNLSTVYLVNKIHTVFDGKILTKEYRYQNALQHFNGKGFLGFEKTFASDVYESELVDNKYRIKSVYGGIYWTINTYSWWQDQALVSSTYGSLNPDVVFTKTIYSNNRFLKGNRNLTLRVKESTTDYLKNITITKDYHHDHVGDLLLQEVVTNYNNDAVTTEKYTYKPEFVNEEHYFFGKISSTETTSVHDGQVFIAKEEQDYDNANGNVTQTRKFGNNTPPIITDISYYPFGGVESTSVTTQGLNTPLETSYVYDATNRFVKDKTTPDGLTTTTIVSPDGKLLSVTDALDRTVSYAYDNWGNMTMITDYLGKKTYISKVVGPVAGSYRLITNKEGGEKTEATFDKFDREVEVKTKTFGNQWVFKSTQYDIFGKEIKYSEPYLEGETIKWNTIGYDDIDRPIKNTLFNGKTVTTCYEGLKVTVENGHRKTSKLLDAMGNIVKHQDEGGTIFYKYYPNGTLKEANYDGIKTIIEIDGWGNKKKLTDPSAGTYLYEYDNLSRIKKETNPQGGITQYTYDDEGFLQSEVTNSATEQTSIVKNYSYDPVTKLPTGITGTYNGKAYIYTTLYDDVYFRITGKKEQTPDFLYETEISYDDFGRQDIVEIKTTLSTPSHTTSSEVKNVYDDNGILIRQVDNQSSNTIWELNTINGYGQTTRMTYGNGYVLDYTYDTSNSLLERISHTKGNNTVLDIAYEHDVTKGVLLKRSNLVFSTSEKFGYDGLDRLIKEAVNGIITKEYTYDAKGRMTSNTDIGKYNYNDTDYKLQSVDFNTAGSTLNNQRGFATVSYNSFKLPNEIILEGKDRISYDYSILQTRSATYYGSLDATATERPNRKYYSSDKAIEIIKEGDNTKIITYITGNPYNANFIKIDFLTGGNLTSAQKYYLHRDNQGTILAITKADANGTVVEKRYFDAWGNLKGALIGNSTTVQFPNSMGWINGLLLDRGYTGHEHLTTVGLVHMNGRIYDPTLRRFLSPDNYVQDLTNTQNYNRYGYVYNNPLLYADPSGEIIVEVAIAIGISMIMNGLNNLSNGVPFWYGAGKAAVIGGISGAVSFHIGTITSGAFSNTVAQGVLQASAHAITGGLISEFSGGDFMSGFASGAVSSIISSGIAGFSWRNGDLKAAVMIAAGGLSGGISSSIAGGNFWDGARQGLITSGLNHAANHLQQKKQYLSFADIEKVFNAYPSPFGEGDEYVSPEELYDLIGGSLGDHYDKIMTNDNTGDDAYWINTCAARLSYALNKAGFFIPKNAPGAWSGANGLSYIVSAPEMFKYLKQTYNMNGPFVQGTQFINGITAHSKNGNRIDHVDIFYNGQTKNSNFHFWKKHYTFYH